jgi:hypothetical protein
MLTIGLTSRERYYTDVPPPVSSGRNEMLQIQAQAHLPAEISRHCAEMFKKWLDENGPCDYNKK